MKSQIAVGLDFFGDGFHRRREFIEFALALRLERPGHRGSSHDQRESQFGRIDAIVDQPIPDFPSLCVKPGLTGVVPKEFSVTKPE